MGKWEMVRLGDVAIINMGQSPESSTYNQTGEGIPFYQGNADFGERYPVKRFWCSAPKKLSAKGDVLISVRAPIGAMNFSIETCCIGRGLASITPKSQRLEQNYLWYILKSNYEFLNRQGTGSTFKAINKNILTELLIPHPPLDEQKRIAKNLDLASQIVKGYKEQLAELDKLVQSVFYEMFGDPVTNEKGWDINVLSKHLDVIGGYAFKSESFSADGIPILRIGNINSGQFKSTNLVFWKKDDKLKKYMVYPDDLVISLTGTVGKEDYGNICVIGHEYKCYYLNQRNARLKLKDQLNTYYVSFLLKTSQIKGKLTGISRGVRQANISNSDILHLAVPVPPLPLQTRFASIVTEIEAQKIQVQEALTEAENLFNSLMQEYFE